MKYFGLSEVTAMLIIIGATPSKAGVVVPFPGPYLTTTLTTAGVGPEFQVTDHGTSSASQSQSYPLGSGTANATANPFGQAIEAEVSVTNGNASASASLSFYFEVVSPTSTQIDYHGSYAQSGSGGSVNFYVRLQGTQWQA